jgi:hypothetical protein
MARQTRTERGLHQIRSHCSSWGTNRGPDCFGEGLLRFRRKNHLLSDTLLSWLLLDMTSSYLLLLLLILLLERMLRLMLLAMLLLLTMLLMHRMLKGLYVLRRQGGRSAGLLR